MSASGSYKTAKNLCAVFGAAAVLAFSRAPADAATFVVPTHAPEVLVQDTDTGVQSRFQTRMPFEKMLYLKDGSFLGLNQEQGQIVWIKDKKDKDSFYTGEMPWDFVVSRNERHILVAGYYKNRILNIDLYRSGVTTEIPLGTNMRPIGLDMMAGEKLLALCDGPYPGMSFQTHGLAIIDVKANKFVVMHDIDINAKKAIGFDDQALVMDRKGSLFNVNLRDGAIQKMPFDAIATGMMRADDTHALIAAQDKDGKPFVAVYDGTTNKITHSFSVDQPVQKFLPTSDSTYVVGILSTGKMVLIDWQSGAQRNLDTTLSFPSLQNNL